MSKNAKARIEQLIAADVAALGYDLVRVLIKGNGKYATLQVMAERQDGGGMLVDDCAALSKLITAKLDADAELTDKFDLEVSSPGIDRPLMKPRDYARFQGHVAKVELQAPQDGIKRFQGRIVRATDAEVEFGTDKGALNLAYDAIAKAQLVLTDDLLKAARNGKVTH